MRWRHIRVEIHKDKDGNTVNLARIGIRAATSKVRKGRTLLCRNGQYFERIQELFGKRSAEDLIFSIDGKRTINLKTLNKYFRAMLEEVEIADVAGRGIVLYSLRHFMITQRIMSGLNFRAIAEMCGTSITQIERTYYHLNNAIRLTNSVADYRLDSDGTICVV